MLRDFWWTISVCEKSFFYFVNVPFHNRLNNLLVMWCSNTAISLVAALFPLSSLISWKVGSPLSCDLSLISIVVWVSLAFNTWVLKPLSNRPRPFEVLDDVTVVGDPPLERSFVSSHTVIVAAASWGAILWLEEYRFLFLGLFSLGALVGLARVWMGVHYISDVVGAFFLAGAITLLMSRILMTAFLCSGAA